MASQPANEEVDHASLQKPMQTGITGVEQIVRCLSSGTSEIQDLVRYECDILFECRVCHSIFRALPNFLAHKRFYCAESVTVSQGIREVEDSTLLTTEDSQEEQLEESHEQTAESYGAEDDSEVESSATSWSDSDNESLGNKQVVKGKSGAARKHDPSDALKKSTVIKLNRIDGVTNAVQQVSLGKGDYIYSSRTGHKKLTYMGYAYVKNNTSPGGDKHYWKCERFRLPCMGRAVTDTSDHVLAVTDHVHQPDLQEIKSRKKKNLENATKTTGKRKREEEVEFVGTSKKLKKEEETVVKVEPEEATGHIHMSLRKKSELTKNTKYADSSTEKEEAVDWRSYADTAKKRCKLCKQVFKEVKFLLRHMRTLHSGRRKMYRCPFCERAFTKTSSLKRHIEKGHNKSKKQLSKMTNLIQKHVFIQKTPELSPLKIKQTGKGGKHAEDVGNVSKDTKAKISEKARKESKKTLTSKKAVQDKMVSQTIVRPSVAKKLKSPSINKLVEKLTLSRCSDCGKVFSDVSALSKHKEDCIQHVQRKSSLTEADETDKRKNITNGKETQRSKSVNKNEDESKTGTNKDTDEGNHKQEEEKFADNSVCISDDESLESDSNDEEINEKFERLKEKGVKIDEKTLKCLQCSMTYKTKSSLIRHCIRHLGWRRFKCKYCRFTAYHKSECKSHISRVHKMKPKNAHELNRCIVEIDVTQRSHKINLNISPNQPVRTVKAAFAKKTKEVDAPSDKAQEESARKSPTEGVCVTRSGRISQAPKTKYDYMDNSGKTSGKTSRPSSGKSSPEPRPLKEKKRQNTIWKGKNCPQKSTSGGESSTSVQDLFKKLGPGMIQDLDSNVQMQCLKLKSSEGQGQNNPLKDLIKKQENVQVVNHGGKKFYVVVMPKGQTLPKNVTPTKTDVAPEVINQALSLMKSPIQGLHRGNTDSEKRAEQTSSKSKVCQDDFDPKCVGSLTKQLQSKVDNVIKGQLSAKPSSVEVTTEVLTFEKDEDEVFELVPPTPNNDLNSTEHTKPKQAGEQIHDDAVKAQTYGKEIAAQKELQSKRAKDEDTLDSPQLEPISMETQEFDIGSEDTPPKLGQPYEISDFVQEQGVNLGSKLDKTETS